METRTYTVYTFDELKKEHQEKAIENYRQIYDEGINLEELLFNGSDIENEIEKNGFIVKKEYALCFDLSCTQGSGAHFHATIDPLQFLRHNKLTKKYKKLIPHIENGELEYTIDNNFLHNHYTHKRTVTISYQFCVDNEELEKLAEALEIEIEEKRLKLCNDLYKYLSKEYDYLSSDEAVAETLKANDYMFTEDGKID